MRGSLSRGLPRPPPCHPPRRVTGIPGAMRYLKCIVEMDEEWRLADLLEDRPLSLGVLGKFGVGLRVEGTRGPRCA